MNTLYYCVSVEKHIEKHKVRYMYSCEVVFLENVWRQQITKAQFVSLYLIFANVLPFDLIEHIVYYTAPRVVVDLKSNGEFDSDPAKERLHWHK